MHLTTEISQQTSLKGLQKTCGPPPPRGKPSYYSLDEWTLSLCLFPSSDGELTAKQGSQFLPLLDDLHHQKVLCCVELKSEMYLFLVLPSGMRGTTLLFFFFPTRLPFKCAEANIASTFSS